MDAQELRNLQEAYMEVVENQQLDEISQQTKMRAFKDRATRDFESDGDSDNYTKSGKNKTDKIKANIVKKHGKKAGEHAERAAHAGIFGRKSSSMPKKPTNTKEDLDIFDAVLEYLQVEGIAESFEDAQWMMVNVLDEEDVDSILDEARRADKEGYARGSKENPKRKDIPHGDVSQRSMLHSKLKRRADEMGRDRRGSERNQSGGRTPVGKKEKSFLKAKDRTARSVRNPNVPDTGSHTEWPSQRRKQKDPKQNPKHNAKK